MMAGSKFVLVLALLPADCAAFVCGGIPTPRNSAIDVKMWKKAAKGPFPIPKQPANFDGAQWAPECFPPFPINVPNVQQAAESVKEILEKEAAPAPAAAAAPAPAAPAPAPAADKSTFTVTLKNPDGDQVVEYDPASDMYLLDYLDELDNADDFAELPYACRAGSCSACAGKVVSGTVDASGCGFLDEEQKAAGWILTCTAKPTSDVVIETHQEDNLY